MKFSGTILATAVAVLFCLSPVALADEPSSPALVEMVICLDTSGSMEGLIDAARQKLWAIVNDLATAKPTPRFRLALVTFGNTGHPADAGWVKVETDFTDDLDNVSRALFALSTNGGDEYVGRVLQAAIDQLSWTGGAATAPGGNNLRLVFVAGNESAEQDPQVDFRDVCRRAISGDIMVNSIYCGPAADELAPAWREVASLADGHFASIDKDQGTVVIVTPFDDAMGTLSADLNTTYIPMGEEGKKGWANQAEQDDNADSLNKEAAAQRAQSKSAKLYVCSWDLLDALEQGSTKLEEIDTNTLPEELRNKTLEELTVLVEQKRARRAELQAEIAELAKQRQAFIDAEMKRQSLDDKSSFDRAVRKAVRTQAESQGFEFAEEGEE